MTWLYIPPRALTPAARRVCSAYRSAPAPAASTSDLRWPSPDTVLWVTSGAGSVRTVTDAEWSAAAKRRAGSGLAPPEPRQERAKGKKDQGGQHDGGPGRSIETEGGGQPGTHREHT